MKCARCGQVNPAGQRFCGHCGNPLQASLSAEGERKLATILFTDIVGSTAMAEKLDPEDWREVVTGAHQRVGRAVDRYGGTIVQLLGDGVLAFFGAPVAHEDDAERAVRAALDIQAAMSEYAGEIAGRVQNLQVRVGLNTGLVVVGNVGTAAHMEYLAIGDSVNTAARMQSAAEPGTVLISEDTYQLIKHAFDCRPRGAIEVKGKSMPIEVYEVLVSKPTPDSARGLEGLDSPLVGRQAEFDVLRSGLENLRAGRGGFVAVVGEAGLGKSRLIAELHKLTTRDPQSQVGWLEGRSISYGESISYYPWRQIIRQSINAQEGDSPAAVREKLKYVCDCCTLPGGDIPFLEAMLAVESEESWQTVAGYQGDALVERMTEATRGYICSIAQMAPTVLIFDDLHWADAASLELLLNICDMIEGYPLLVATLLRPDREAPSWSFIERLEGKLNGYYTEISLEPLTDQHSSELLANLLPIAASLPSLPTAGRAGWEGRLESVSNLILKKAEGNPFFVEEIIRSLIDAQYLVRDDSRPGPGWRLTGEIANVTIPNTLAGVLSARIDRLPEDTRRVAQMSAVIGRIFEYRVLKTICATAPENERIVSLEPHLGVLTRQELVREGARMPELEYIFKHALTHEAAYNSLLIKRRKEFHRRAGAILETLYAGRLDEFAPMLAHHFWCADEWERAAEYAMRAATRAMKVYALPEARAHYQRALEALDKQPDAPPERVYDAIIGWVEAAFKVRPYAEQLERLARAERIARELNDKQRLAQALHWITDVYLARGLWTRARPVLTESFAVAQELGDERLAMRPTLFAGFIAMLSSPRDAHPPLQRAIELARKYEARDVEALALAIQGQAHAQLGEFEQALAAIRLAKHVARTIDSPVTDADVDLFSAWAYLDMGDTRHALEHGQRSVETALATDSMDCACSAFACLGFGKLQSQALPEATDAFEEAINRSEISGAILAQILARSGLAITRIAGGYQRAVEDLEKALASALEIDYRVGVAHIERALGESLMHLGELERAAGFLSSAVDFYRRTEMCPYLGRALQSLADAYEKQGRQAEAGEAHLEADSIQKELEGWA
jgi:class 3 adenylate cyclase/tetratricopeptide (TPR) repeat protein